MKETIQKIIRLRRTQKQRRAMLFNDMMPGFLAVIAGISFLRDGSASGIAIASILVGGLLIVFGIKEWRGEQEGENRFNWIDSFGGVVAFLDAAAMYKPGKGFQPATLYFVASVFILLKGSFPALRPHRRTLTITTAGFKIQLAPFSSLKCMWDEIQTLSTDPSFITVSMKNGNSQTFKLRRTENVSEALDALKESARDKGILVNGT